MDKYIADKTYQVIIKNYLLNAIAIPVH